MVNAFPPITEGSGRSSRLDISLWTNECAIFSGLFESRSDTARDVACYPLRDATRRTWNALRNWLWLWGSRRSLRRHYRLGRTRTSSESSALFAASAWTM
jgi:hypothetical protein